MKLGVMQPYFFPHLGYFDLIRRTDRFLLFDIVQFTKKSWMTRNRILHPKTGWQYVLVPVARHERSAVIRDIRIKDPAGAKTRILGQLAHYRDRAPHYSLVVDMVRETFDRSASDSLAHLNASSLARACERLGQPFRVEICSEMNLALPAVTHPGRWALEICSALGAAEYINPPGGRELFSSEAFAARGIRLTFTETPDFRYECRPYGFEPRLSILDVLMWCSPEDVASRLASTALSRPNP